MSKMKVVGGKETNKVEAPKKLSYEELESVASRLSEQSKLLYEENQRLKSACDEINAVNFYKRMDYLWLILTQGDKAFGLTDEFKSNCAQEFMVAMTMPDSPEEKVEE